MCGFTPCQNFGVDWVVAAGDCAAVAEDFGDSACGALAWAEFLWREGGRDGTVASWRVDGSRAAGEEEGGRDGDVAR